MSAPRRRRAWSRAAWPAPAAALWVIAWVGCNRAVELFEQREPPSAAGAGGGSGGLGGDGGADTGGIGVGAQPSCDALQIGEACESSTDCCTGLCALDESLELTCRPTTGCLGVGEPCQFASQCCSIGCSRVGVEILELRCTEVPMCTLAGLPCSEDASCCTGRCDESVCAEPKTGACVPAGERCANDGECCGGSCSVLDDDERRCALAQACRVSGEQCAVDGDCCSGQCDLDLDGVLRCLAGASCAQTDGKSCTAQAGEVCSDDSDCCTGACDPSSDGPNRCAYLAGCRQDCELCSTGAACCSGTCEKDAEGTPRCSAAGAAACADVGSVCGGPTDCCPDGPDGDCGIASVTEATKRCLVDGPARPEGEPCKLPGQCAGEICVPDAQGMLRCSSECRSADEPCTATSDCCDPGSNACAYLDGKAVCAALIGG